MEYNDHHYRNTTENRPPIIKKIDSEEFSERFDTWKLLLGVQRHWIVILTFAAIFGVLGTIASYKFLTTYQAEAIVLYQGEEQISKNIKGGYTVTNLSMATVIDMIKMPKHFVALKAKLGLDLEPGVLSSMVMIQRPKQNSKLIRIKVKSKNPNLAVDIANSLAQISVATSELFVKKQLKVALANYLSQQQVLKHTLSKQMRDIEEFKTQHNYYEMDPAHSVLLTQLGGAQKSRDNAVLEYDSLQVQYENLKNEAERMPDYVPITSDSKDSPLRTRIISLQTTLAQARAKYTKENPKIQLIEDELKELLQESKYAVGETPEQKLYEKNQVKQQLELELLHLRGKVRSAQKVKEDVIQNLKELDKQLATIPVQQMTLVRLLHTQKTTEGQLNYLTDAVESAQLLLNVPKGSINIYQLAQQAGPWKDRWWVEPLPILAILFGLGCGVVFAFFLETQDSRLRTAKQVNMSYSVPCVLTIPEMFGITKNNADKKSLFYVRRIAEYIENKWIELTGNKIKDEGTQFILTVTSSFAGEGKTFIAYHLTKYFQKLSKKSIIIEFDNQHNPFVTAEEVPEVSLGKYMEGKATLQEIIYEGQVDRIKLLETIPDLKELIKSNVMDKLLNELKSKYDVIIIDAPGVVEEDYSNNIAMLSDLSLFVIGSTQTKKAVVDESLKVLDASNVRPSGIVLNRVQSIYFNDIQTYHERAKSRKAFIKNLFTKKR